MKENSSPGQTENPKGILPQSPGLRGTSYPGYSARAHRRESQRDSASKPRVARNELPWVFCARTPQRIPKGFCLKAQGCEERATLGILRTHTSTPKELCHATE